MHIFEASYEKWEEILTNGAVMEESNKKSHVEGGDKEILYSKAIKAGKRIYYLDVKKNLKDDLFLAVTESKKVQSKDGAQVTFEKHKIFLYKEDFEKFMDGMHEVINYIKQRNQSMDSGMEDGEDGSADDIKLDIDF
ncbi:mevalonate pyrophosphate decarboxylase [Parabacteroides sp. PM5-20]|nr:mevalonate pyrophosphate decarboxylase [Parabacteroides sp. PM5-20]